MTITKNQAILASVAVFVLIVLFGLRTITPEDEWRCENGKWMAHGNPTEAKPIVDCKSDIRGGNSLDDTSCQSDADCACGANRISGKCFVGNKSLVDKNKQCPGFCPEAADASSIKCVRNQCVKNQYLLFKFVFDQSIEIIYNWYAQKYMKITKYDICKKNNRSKNKKYLCFNRGVFQEVILKFVLIVENQ